MRVWPAISTLAMTALAACGGSGSQPTEAEGTTAASQDGPAATTVVGETAQRPAGGPPPPELQGTWLRKTELGPVRLYITENLYTISAGGSGQGAIVVDGDELGLFNSTAPSCRALKLPEGVGRYRWSIADGKLHLSRIGRDPCGARADLLSNTTFQRTG